MPASGIGAVGAISCAAPNFRLCSACGGSRFIAKSTTGVAVNYEIFGPYEVPREGDLVSREAKIRNKFWKEVDEDEEGLQDACGCYMLVIRNKAWYVGMAEKQSFKNECFQLHKIVQYDSALQKAKGIPYLIFLAKMTPSGSFASPGKNGYSDVRALEQLLIGAAIDRNPKLCNIKDTKVLRHMNVPGFLNSKKGQATSRAVQEFKRAIGV